MSRTVRVGLVGCGSVSEKYLPDLAACPHVELVAVCDVVPERARQAAAQFHVAAHFADFDRMLDAADIELLVNTTNMQNHARYNLAALRAGCHVWSEKPIATTLRDGEALVAAAEEQSVHLWGAPNAVTSPAFAEMSRVIQSGALGKVCAAHARYGHPGELWTPWFFQRGGGSLFDLGVYNVTTLTGLLGPARSVVALAGVAVPRRTIAGETVEVEADDNTMLLMDFAEGVMGCVRTGFVYRYYRDEATIEVVGTEGTVNMLGFDWAPRGVEVRTRETDGWETRAADQKGYAWQKGASYVATCLVEGREPLVTTAHTFHVLEVMLAALESARSGRRVEIRSQFPHPLPV
jgi:predicted dehydrogenase